MNKTVQIVMPEVIGHVAPEIYGHFTELIGGVFYDGLWVGRDSPIPNIRGFRKDLVEKLRAIRPAVLRWPGGCFAETYHWRDGIGPNRPVRPSWWTSSDGRYESNAVGTHEFLDLCELVGAKAYLAVNVTSVTPLEAREWMDYCLSPRGSTTLALEREGNGHPEPFRVDYWGIGNENWGGGGYMTPDTYAREYRRFATVLSNLCGAPASNFIIGGANGGDFAWTRGVLENLFADPIPSLGMSFHFYTTTSPSSQALDFDEKGWYDVLSRCEWMETLIRRHAAIAAGYGMEERARLVIDEWGCWHAGGSGPSKGANLFEQQSTMRDALVTALTLNIFNNHCDRVMMANAAQLCNNLHCLFLAGGEHCVVTPAYHVFDLFKDHQGGDALRVLVGGNDGDIRERLSVSASVKDGRLTVTFANASCGDDAEVDLRLLGAPDGLRDATLTLLAASDIHAHNTFEDPDAVAPVRTAWEGSPTLTLPRASVATLRADIGRTDARSR